MQKVLKCLWTLGLAGVGAWAAGADAAPPKLDGQKLDAYVRYLEGYTPQVKISFEAPVPSAYRGFFRVVVHLKIARDNGIQPIGDKLYYTADGERFVSGQLFEVGQNPFADTLALLPTDGPSFGPASAKVTMIVFSDFQCPYCREFAKTLRVNVQQKYPDEVRVIFENFPLESIHPWAFAAAAAGYCMANEQPGAFWAFHDWIFEHQGEVTQQNLKEKVLAFVQAQKLPPGNVAACLERPESAAAIRESLRVGRELQIQQTPSLFLNGRMVGGALPWDTLNAVIQLELGRPKEIPAPASNPCCGLTPPTVLGK